MKKKKILLPFLVLAIGWRAIFPVGDEAPLQSTTFSAPASLAKIAIKATSGHLVPGVRAAMLSTVGQYFSLKRTPRAAKDFLKATGVIVASTTWACRNEIFQGFNDLEEDDQEMAAITLALLSSAIMYGTSQQIARFIRSINPRELTAQLTTSYMIGLTEDYIASMINKSIATTVEDTNNDMCMAE